MSSHFVDDFYLCEPSHTASDAFASVSSIHSSLGFEMKETKSKPPTHQITLLGVEWNIDQDEVRASAGKERVDKLVKWVTQILQADRLSPTEASKLAGRLHFVCSWVFASVGKALLKPLYKRQQASSLESSHLSVAVRWSLYELLALLPQLNPVSFPIRPNESPVCVLYADAFVNGHGVRRAANKWLPSCLQASSLADSTNGWGAVFLASSVPRAFRSQVPMSLLVQSSPTKAYIFCLEAIAQVLSVLCIQPFVKGHLV